MQSGELTARPLENCWRSATNLDPKTIVAASNAQSLFDRVSGRCESGLLRQLADAELVSSEVLAGRRQATRATSVDNALRALGATPVDVAALCRTHSVVVGTTSFAGRLRTNNVAIGGDRTQPCTFVAPGHEQVSSLLRALTEFLADSAPSLHNAALAFGWFEAIHPFEDGNGRVGRVLLRKLLNDCCSSNPVGPLSLALMHDKHRFVEAHRALRLGDGDTWVRYVASAATECATALMSHVKEPLSNSTT